MPGAKYFIDSNVLLYAHDERDAVRELEAKAWLKVLADEGLGVLNLQVINEFTAVLLRKNWLADVEKAFEVAAYYSAFGESLVTQMEVEIARHLHRRYRYSWWDCILLASAFELGCTHFLSEDLQDGQVVTDSSARSLTIVDPFVHSPEQILPS